MAQIVVDYLKAVDVGDDDAHGPEALLLQPVRLHAVKGAAAQAGEGVVADHILQFGSVALRGADVCMQADDAGGPAKGVAVGHVPA